MLGSFSCIKQYLIGLNLPDSAKSELEDLRRLAEEKKLLESQMEVERRKLEREQEALKKDSEKLET